MPLAQGRLTYWFPDHAAPPPQAASRGQRGARTLPQSLGTGAPQSTRGGPACGPLRPCQDFRPQGRHGTATCDQGPSCRRGDVRPGRVSQVTLRVRAPGCPGSHRCRRESVSGCGQRGSLCAPPRKQQPLCARCGHRPKRRGGDGGRVLAEAAETGAHRGAWCCPAWGQGVHAQTLLTVAAPRHRRRADANTDTQTAPQTEAWLPHRLPRTGHTSEQLCEDGATAAIPTFKEESTSPGRAAGASFPPVPLRTEHADAPGITPSGPFLPHFLLTRQVIPKK